MIRKHSGWIAAALGGLSLLLPAPRAAGYAFTNIVDNTQAYTRFYIPAMNDAGEVAFVADRGAGQGGNGVFVGHVATPGTVTRVADNTGPIHNFYKDPVSISAAGVVAFKVFTDDDGTGNFGTGIFGAGVGRPAYSIADTSGPFGGFDGLDISPAGALAFYGTRDNGVTGVFTVAPDGTVGTIADSTGKFGWWTPGDPSINAAGTVAFMAAPYVGNWPAYGLWTRDAAGGSEVKIVDRLGRFNGFTDPVMNASGVVAFHGALDVAAYGVDWGGIYKGSGAALTQIAAEEPFDGPYEDLDETVAIDAAGNVLFLGNPNEGRGIYFGPNPDTDYIIRGGDPLFGSTLSWFEFEADGLNDSGQLAFYYELTNGRKGIAVVTIPEPAGVVTLAALGLIAWRRPRHRH